ncbi:MAG: hypothetical protein AAFX39_12360 [Pseudomonadota bacterium]
MANTSRATSPIAVMAVLAAAAALAGCSSNGQGIGEMANAMIEEPIRAIGLAPDRRPDIEYMPRSPLVMPSSTDLNTPLEERQTADLGEQWPNDPDVLAAQQREQERDIDREEMLADRNGRGEVALSPTELDQWARDAGIAPDTGARTVISDRGRSGDETQQFDPDEQAVSLVEQPLERRSLVEPPLEYRVPAAGGVIPGQEPEEEKSRLSRWLGF